MKNNKNISKVKCEHPVVIVRHDILKYIVSKGYNAIMFDDRCFLLRNTDILKAKRDYYSGTKTFGKVINAIIGDYHEADDIDRVCLLNTNTGEVHPLLMEVPCGHCSLCRHSYIEKWVTRCMLQESFDGQEPTFITLTYNDENYEEFRKLHEPDSKRAYHVKEMQQFTKKLRRDLERDGYLPTFKYFAVSEYGSRRGRLHYHVAIYGLDPELLSEDTARYVESYSDKQRADCHVSSRVPRIYNYIRANWTTSYKGVRRDKYSDDEFQRIVESHKKGIVDIQKSKGNTPRYITKYITKGTKESKDTIFLKSKRFGLSKILEFKEQLREDPTISQFLIACRGQIQTIPVSKYVIDNCYPNINRSISVEDRLILKRLFDSRNIIQTYIDAYKYVKLTRLWECMELELSDACDYYTASYKFEKPFIRCIGYDVSFMHDYKVPRFKGTIMTVDAKFVFTKDNVNSWLDDFFNRVNSDECYVSHMIYLEHMNSLEELDYDISFEVKKEEEKQALLKRIERDDQ